jgi:hypothetical protein
MVINAVIEALSFALSPDIEAIVRLAGTKNPRFGDSIPSLGTTLSISSFKIQLMPLSC